jgi:preprotein translocase subunit YajC
MLMGTFALSSAVWAVDPAPGAGAPGGGLMAVVPWILIFAIFYFLLIRPQQKQAKEQKKMLDALKRGDRVLTQGGLYGTINAVKGKVLEVKLNDEVKVMIARTAVSQVVQGDPSQETNGSNPPATA